MSLPLSVATILRFKNKRVYIMAGFPGSGKSTLAKKIARQLDCVYFSSDEIREELANQSRFDQIGDAEVNKVRDLVYSTLYTRTVTALKAGRKVVLDATHLEPAKFAQALPLLWEVIAQDQVCFITVKTPFSVIDARMKKFDSIPNTGSMSKTDSTESAESIYQGWRRVYGYMQERKKNGLIVWPTQKQTNIEQFSSQLVEQMLRHIEWIIQIRHIFWDLDGTLYPQNPDMNAHIEMAKMQAIAAHLKCSPQQAQAIFSKHYAKLKSATRVLDALGLPGQDFFIQIWKTVNLSKFIAKNPTLVKAFAQSIKQNTISHGMLTNSNTQETAGIKLKAIGLKAHIFSPLLTSVEIGFNKPDLRAFAPVLGLQKNPAHLMYIGDKEHTDIVPAKTCGIKTVLMLWDQKPPQDSVADLVCTTPVELLELFSTSSHIHSD